MFSGRLVLALVAAALCLGARTADAQAAPVSYWIPYWPVGFGADLPAGQSPNTYGDFPSFDGRDARGGAFSYQRYNFSNGWFVGGGGVGGSALNMSGISQDRGFGNIRYYSEGVQFGYNFRNAPLSVYAGVDTLKYDAGIGNPFAPFDKVSGTLPGYSAHVGVEFRPTSNLSLSLGAGVVQQSGGGDIGSLSLPGASPFAVGGRR